uniref:Uncharacterized protein n=1 Tax=Anopheles arabiensis TaxID=7173 RepID=A0A182IF68_ANOAR
THPRQASRIEYALGALSIRAATVLCGHPFFHSFAPTRAYGRSLCGLLARREANGTRLARAGEAERERERLILFSVPLRR